MGTPKTAGPAKVRVTTQSALQRYVFDTTHFHVPLKKPDGSYTGRRSIPRRCGASDGLSSVRVCLDARWSGV